MVYYTVAVTKQPNYHIKFDIISNHTLQKVLFPVGAIFYSASTVPN